MENKTENQIAAEKAMDDFLYYFEQKHGIEIDDEDFERFMLALKESKSYLIEIIKGPLKEALKEALEKEIQEVFQ